MGTHVLTLVPDVQFAFRLKVGIKVTDGKNVDTYVQIALINIKKN